MGNEQCSLYLNKYNGWGGKLSLGIYAKAWIQIVTDKSLKWKKMWRFVKDVYHKVYTISFTAASKWPLPNVNALY